MTLWPLAPKQRYTLVLASGAAFRLILFATTSLPRLVQDRPELRSPLTSFRSLHEGVFIYERGANPYLGGVFYHSPLQLFFFSDIIPIRSYPLTALFWSLCDTLGALILVQIWRTRIGRGSLAPQENRDWLVSAVYLFNPYIILSCLARSTTSIDNALLLLSLAMASQGNELWTCCLLAVLVHTSFYPVFLIPLILLLLRRSSSKPSSLRTVSSVVQIAAFMAIIAFVNGKMFGWSWARQTWGVTLSVPDLTPNVGMWWYFFTEMFDHFRDFFLGAFQLHNAIYVLPVCLRLKHDPLLATIILVGVLSTWKSYPTLGDLGLWAGLLACVPEVVSNLRHPLFTLTVYLYTIILLPLLHSLWLLTGTGNANFFYAATMVHGLNSSLAIVDVLGAALKHQVKQGVSEKMAPLTSDRNPLLETIRVEEEFEKGRWAPVQFASREQ